MQVLADCSRNLPSEYLKVNIDYDELSWPALAMKEYLYPEIWGFHMFLPVLCRPMPSSLTRLKLEVYFELNPEPHPVSTASTTFEPVGSDLSGRLLGDEGSDQTPQLLVTSGCLSWRKSIMKRLKDMFAIVRGSLQIWCKSLQWFHSGLAFTMARTEVTAKSNPAKKLLGWVWEQKNKKNRNWR